MDDITIAMSNDSVDMDVINCTTMANEHFQEVRSIPVKKDDQYLRSISALNIARKKLKALLISFLIHLMLVILFLSALEVLYTTLTMKLLRHKT